MQKVTAFSKTKFSATEKRHSDPCLRVTVSKEHGRGFPSTASADLWRKLGVSGLLLQGLPKVKSFM